MWSITVLLPMLAVGLFSGFIAGLFGIGGGMLLVPVVLWALQIQGFGGLAHAQHIAIGTTFAVMVFTSFSSAYAQYKKDAVDWQVFAGMAPGMLAGVAAGALVARFLPNRGLQIFFVFFTLAVAVRTLCGFKPKPSRRLPGRPGLFAAGGLFGMLSSWVGIGGGSLTVPFLTFCNVPMHRCVGTSAALGWPIAFAGSVGYALFGLHEPGLPPGSAGFVYLPAAAVLAGATMTAAPVGVKLAHRWPPETLKKGFGILLLLIAAGMIWKIWLK